MLEPSAYSDPFARDHLPPEALWPQMDVAELMARLPRHYNAAAALLEAALAKGFGERVALIGGDTRLTYDELDAQSNRIAHVLTHDYGLKPGNRVLLRGANTPMLAACWFGVLKAGGIAVTTMPLLRARELGKIIEKAAISHALCDARIADALFEAAKEQPTLKTIGLFGSEAADGLEARMAGKPADYAAFQPSREDVALIAFTSGTTGKPKATLHFHRDIAAICETVPEHVLHSTPEDVFTGSAPLGFTYGLGSLLLFPLLKGAASVLLERATPESMLAAIRTHQVTTLLTGPTLYRTMLAVLQNGDVASLRLCCSSGEHLPAALQKAWFEKTGLLIRNILGSTEMLHAFVAADEASPMGSLGRAMPPYQAKVVDEAGHAVPAGVIGRLAVRGPTGCRYLSDDARQQTYVSAGWNITGDAFSVDETGTLWYHARSDDMIVSSGYNISGPEIEEVLFEHPQVQTCCVVGVPDAARGMIAKAFVVLHEPSEASPALAEALQAHVKATLAPYKYPRAVEFIDELPMTTTGKVQRSALRG